MKFTDWFKINFEKIGYPQMMQLLRKKIITQNGLKIEPHSIIQPDKIKIKQSPLLIQKKARQFNTEPIKNWIIFENDEFIAINKPHNIIVQGAQDSIIALTQTYPVHKLDKSTSGVMLLAKTEEAARSISQEFQEHRVKKTYIAFCHTHKKLPEQGIWVDEIDGKKCVTHYKIIEEQDGKAMLLFNPETGRKHQIRIQASRNGAPIIGDTLYFGAKASRIYLHSHKISFKLGNQFYEFKANFF